jgi:hypothetical protein
MDPFSAESTIAFVFSEREIFTELKNIVNCSQDRLFHYVGYFYACKASSRVEFRTHIRPASAQFVQYSWFSAPININNLAPPARLGRAIALGFLYV